MSNSALSVLVVDDSVVQANHAAVLCQSIATRVAVAHDGVQALTALKAETFDIALIDLEMPVMDGVELISHIAAEKLVDSIVILSSKDSSLIASVGSMAEAEGLNVLTTIQKPVTNELLVQCLHSHHGKPARLEEDSLAEGEDGLSYNDLLMAIIHKQFFLYYQPKLTCHGLLLRGVEALARWEHPERGFIPPDIFIAAAERYKLIGTLTLLLFEQALQQKKIWQDKGFNFNLALNLSPSSLNNCLFADSLADFVGGFGVKLSDITLEVTENMLLGDVAKSLQILARLRLKGFMISIDDYGSGFANAEQLSRLPATELKLDRSIINGIANKHQLRAIVDSTIRLANQLNLKTVAEGVESEEDYLALKKLGVYSVQGYFFSRPISAKSLERWVQSELKVLRGN